MYNMQQENSATTHAIVPINLIMQDTPTDYIKKQP